MISTSWLLRSRLSSEVQQPYWSPVTSGYNPPSPRDTLHSVPCPCSQVLIPCAMCTWVSACHAPPPPPPPLQTSGLASPPHRRPHPCRHMCQAMPSDGQAGTSARASQSKRVPCTHVAFRRISPDSHACLPTTSWQQPRASGSGSVT